MARVRVIRDPLRYGFAVGRIRVLETRLLPRSTYERLLDAPSFDEQRRILSETPYGTYLEQAETAEDVERALDKALGDLYADFLERANLPDPIVHYFRMLHDFENVRGRLKAEALGIDAGELLTELGATSGIALGAERVMPERVAKAERVIRDVVQRADDTLDPALIDAAVDAEMHRVLGEIACDSGSEFLCTFAALSADLGNLKVFVRARAKDLDVADVERLFVPGGTVPVAALLQGYRMPVEEAVRRVATMSAFRDVDLETVMDPARLDVVIDQLLARELHRARMAPMGPEPVLAYVAMRRSEIRRVRMLLIGKLAGVATDVLRERMRDVA